MYGKIIFFVLFIPLQILDDMWHIVYSIYFMIYIGIYNKMTIYNKLAKGKTTLIEKWKRMLCQHMGNGNALNALIFRFLTYMLTKISPILNFKILMKYVCNIIL